MAIRVGLIGTGAMMGVGLVGAYLTFDSWSPIAEGILSGVEKWSGAFTDVRMFFYFYLIYTLVFAMPASNFLIANPLWPAFLGMLCWLRAAGPPIPRL